jgi:hypothetical protein
MQQMFQKMDEKRNNKEQFSLGTPQDFMDCLINEYWIFRELYVNSYIAIK